jgi:transcriptional regulator with XRE-family HTH domain
MDYLTIGLLIKKRRLLNNMTQEQLAVLIPIGRTAISKWERGITIPDLTIVMRLCEIFKISLNELLEIRQ